MKACFRLITTLTLLAFLAACGPNRIPLSPTAPGTPAPPAPAPTSLSRSSHFGVFISAGKDAVAPDVVKAARETGGIGWVRINVPLGPQNLDYTPYLAAGINLILMVSNADPANSSTTNGTPQDWPAAGFPYLSKERYQQQVRALLKPAQPYLAQGRQVWVQAENEVVDVSTNPRELYWRGTDAQYLDQLDALYEAVKSVDKRFPVVLTSFASYLEDILNTKSGPAYEQSDQHVRLFLSKGKYDAVDLHFYGCVEDIPAKIKVIQERLPPGRPFKWISTENAGPDYRCSSTPATWDADPEKFEQLQAAQLPRRLTACSDNGASICLWFSLFDLKKASSLFNHFGLLDQAGSPPRQKPAYAAYNAYTAQQAK